MLIKSAHEILIQADAGLEGGGIGLYILDSGINKSAFLGKEIVNFAQEKGVFLQNNSHGHRLASICCGSKKTNKNKIRVNGIAPKATYYSDSYLRFPDYRECLFSMKNEIERRKDIKIVGFPFSIPLTLESALEGNFFFYELTRKNPSLLIIAAAGHDGKEKIRFPAFCDSIFTVGVYDPITYEITNYCGTDSNKSKPELLVPDFKFLSVDEKGKRAVINGSSAAVLIVASLSSLIYEYLVNTKKIFTSNVVKSILLALSTRNKNGFRLLEKISLGDLINIQYKFLKNTEACFIKLKKINPNKPAKIVLVLEDKPASKLFFTPRTEISLRITTSGNTRDVKYNNNYVVYDVESGDDLRSIEITLSVKAGLTITGENISFRRIDNSVKEKKTNIILGVSASHNASACLMINGKVRRGIQLERITNVKNDGNSVLDKENAIEYCLSSIGLRSANVDYFAFNNQALIPGWVGLSQPVNTKAFRQFDPFSEKSIFVSHHLAHAFAAFSASKFENAIVMVADGAGGSTIGSDDLILTGPELKNYINQEIDEIPKIHVCSIYQFSRTNFTLLNREFSSSFNVRCGSNSPGELYASVSQFVFGNWMDSGKLMGLAPYGRPEKFGESIRSSKNSFSFKSVWKNNYSKDEKSTILDYKDLAARVQKDFENVILDKIGSFLRTNNFKKVNFIFTGGLALNCVLNHKIARSKLIKESYFFSASNDAGISVGSAAAAHFKICGNIPSSVLASEYLGHPYTNEEIKIAIEEYSEYLTCSKVNTTYLAKHIFKGKIVALFQASSEFGPRALGNRSILAEPTKKATWKKINREIKYREDFRPLAPIVPVESASTFFEIHAEHPNMMEVVVVKKDWQKKLKAVTHVDGSARLQTLQKTHNPVLYSLLMEFGKINGIPILINTSMNCAGKTITETPSDAIEFFLSSAVDILVLNNILVLKHDPKQLKNSHVALAPDCSLHHEIRFKENNYFLKSSIKGKEDLQIPEFLYSILSIINDKTIKEILASKQQYKSKIEMWIKFLLKSNYLLVRKKNEHIYK